MTPRYQASYEYQYRQENEKPELAGLGSLLEGVIDATLSRESQVERSRSRLDEFLAEPDTARAIGLWLSAIPLLAPARLREWLAFTLSRDIARIDSLLNDQVNAILHHPSFQKLEASWRGLRYLVEQVPEGENVKIRILNASWKELTRDLERAIEFDQSALFRKVYSEEFGTPGGEPFGLLLGDYAVRHKPGPGHPTDDLAALRAISGIAAASFAPFVAGLDPGFLELDHFTELDLPLDLQRTFEQVDYLKWKSLRETEDSRFLGLVLPRTLARQPYSEDVNRTDRFVFREDTSAPDRSGYLWSNAIYAFGGVVIRSFLQSGWLADIRGLVRGEERGGVVTNLPMVSFGVSRHGIIPKSCTDGVITDETEGIYADLGLMPLCHLPDTPGAAYFTTPSIQKPKSYDSEIATANARLSSMLHYMLCVSRVAHYVKVIARDKMGTFLSASDCQDFLNNWLRQYTTTNDKGGDELKARYPLREAKVEVKEHTDKPGSYFCVIHLRPHFQLDQITTAVRLVTELGPRK